MVGLSFSYQLTRTFHIRGDARAPHGTQMVSQTEFANHVRDALANLYDPVRIQAHPLVSLMQLRPAPGETAGEALRKQLREVVESLRPPASIPVDAPAWEDYRVLQLHYLRSLDQTETCKALSISEATFYRRQRRALQAVVSLLRERHQRSTGPERDAGTTPGEPMPIASESDQGIRLEDTSPQLVDIGVLLNGIKETILPLAEKRGVQVRMRVPAVLPRIHVDISVLRQIVLSALSMWITRSAAGMVELAVSVSDDEILWQVRGLVLVDDREEGLESDRRFSLSQDLLRLYEGHIWIYREEEGVATLAFTVPIAKPKSILIIDDDPKTIDLYRRYLQGSNYVIFPANSVGQAEALLAENRPDLVLLDVIMPRQDGWIALQHLRRLPQMADIPIVVCSVLYQPDLAIALGATRVLTKPITQEQLLETVQECLAQAGNAARVH